MHRLVVLLRRKTAHHLLIRADDFEGHVVGGFLKVIVDDRSVRWVLRRRFFGWQRRPGERIVVDPYSNSRLVEPCRLRVSCVAGLSQWRNVIENPERAAVSSDYEIVAVNHHIQHRNRWEILLQREPVIAVIKGNIDSGFGSRKQQTFSLRVFTDRPQKRWRVDPFCDELPGGAVVASPIQVGRLIIETVAVDSRVGYCRIEMRSLDQIDAAPVAQTLGTHVLPTLSAISRDVDQSCVTARPDQLIVERRWGDRRNYTISSLLGVLCRSRPV